MKRKLIIALFIINNLILSSILTASEIEIPIRIIASADGHGTIDPNGNVWIGYGDSKTFKAIPDPNYGVDTWYTSDRFGIQTIEQIGGETCTITPTANIALWVTFQELPSYSIKSTAGKHGSISPEDEFLAREGEAVTFNAMPKLGFDVDAWYVDKERVQTEGDTYTLIVSSAHEVHVTFKTLAVEDLGLIDFDDIQELPPRIVTNNFVHPNDINQSRLHVEWTDDNIMDPNGAMVMHSLSDPNDDPNDPPTPINARVKAAFKAPKADQIRISFRYLFTTSVPGVELNIYVSDIPELLDHNDPSFNLHYRKIANIPAPPSGRPGAAASGRAAVFTKLIRTGLWSSKDIVWVELELVEPVPSQSVAIDDWGASLECFGICLDINWDSLVDAADFLTVISECGQSAEGHRACHEGIFSQDGYVDNADIASWDWSLDNKNQQLNYCTIPLVENAMFVFASQMTAQVSSSAPPYNIFEIASTASQPLFILGKRGNTFNKLDDRFYYFNTDKQCDSWTDPTTNRGNIRLIKAKDDTAYIIHMDHGITSLEAPFTNIIAPAVKSLSTAEPRHQTSATIQIGLQQHGASVSGRPITDAAIVGNEVFLLPVVVRPTQGHDPYLAAAKARLASDGSGTYTIETIYDPPIASTDNLYSSIRELEVDDQNNVYLLNAHIYNESDTIWRCQPDGTWDQLDLGRKDKNYHCADPISLYVSPRDNTLYVASGQANPQAEFTSLLYSFNTQPTMSFKQKITVDGMQQITALTENPANGDLWILGYNQYNVPFYPNPYAPPFYHPALAQCNPNSDYCLAQDLDDHTKHDLGWPLSIIWTGTNN